MSAAADMSIDNRAELPELYTIAAAAEHLRLSVATVKRLIREGRLGSYRTDGRRLVGGHHIARYLAEIEERGK